jgi:phosphatidylserine decarboxylase
MIWGALGLLPLLVLVFLFWRYVWFFRNPARHPPAGESLLSPADGTVVYVKRFQAGEEVLSIKSGVAARLDEIAPSDLTGARLLIGVFMSPFDVHYNRAPIAGRVEWVRHHPARGRNAHMTSMHWRTLLGIQPFHRESPHVFQNERTVTKFHGLLGHHPIDCFVIQIAGGSVRGIDSYFQEGAMVSRGEIFGIIRVGSQVDVLVPALGSMRVRVKAGDRVRAGETILID